MMNLICISLLAVGLALRTSRRSAFLTNCKSALSPAVGPLFPFFFSSTAVCCGLLVSALVVRSSKQSMSRPPWQLASLLTKASHFKQ